jgi:hypothetical protein
MFIVRSKRKYGAVPIIIANMYNNKILLDKSLNKTKRLNRVELWINDDLVSPFTYGFFRKKIILPGNITEQYEEYDIYLILRHESIHVKNNDSWKQLFVMITHSLNWFNPLLFFLSRCVNESIEMCCDEHAISEQNDTEMQLKYGELLITMAANQRKHTVSEQYFGTKGFTEQRIRVIIQAPIIIKKSAIIFFTLLFLVISFAYLTGFTITDQRIANTHLMSMVDGGKESKNTLLQFTSADILVHNLTEKGAYVFNDYLVYSSINYIPLGFLTHSSQIKLTLKSDNKPILVFIYYYDDLDYPLMQVVLNDKDTSVSFDALSGQHTYIIGLIAEFEFEDKVQISLQE